MPQIDVRDFEYSGRRADFDDGRKAALRAAIEASLCESLAKMVLHVGQDMSDLQQLEYLPEAARGRVRVVRHAVPGHALGAGLKAQDLLRRTVLSDLLGHSYQLPPASSSTCEPNGS